MGLLLRVLVRRPRRWLCHLRRLRRWLHNLCNNCPYTLCGIKYGCGDSQVRGMQRQAQRDASVVFSSVRS